MPSLTQFSALTQKKAKPARNILNEDEIRAACAQARDARLLYLEDEQGTQIGSWIMGAARKHLVRSLPADPVLQLESDAPEWARAALARGERLERARVGPELAERLEHMIDWLLAEPPRQISKLSWEQAEQKMRAWEESLAKKALLEEDPSGVSPLVEAPSMGEGWRWIKVISPAALEREGALMGHCVGSYANRVEAGRCQIVSLRDPSNKPRLTVELLTGEREGPDSPPHLIISQVRGKANRPPETDEAPALIEMVEALKRQGARLSGGDELTRSGAIWDAERQSLSLLKDLAPGSRLPRAKARIGARSGRLPEDLEFGSVTIEALPVEGLPSRLRARTARFLSPPAGAQYDLRGWSGRKLFMDLGFESLQTDGFAQVFCQPPTDSAPLAMRRWQGYAAPRSRELIIQNARKVEVDYGRFDSISVEAHQVKLTRCSAKEALINTPAAPAMCPAGELIASTCSFGALRVGSQGAGLDAMLDTVETQTASFGPSAGVVVHAASRSGHVESTGSDQLVGLEAPEGSLAPSREALARSQAFFDQARERVGALIQSESARRAFDAERGETEGLNPLLSLAARSLGSCSSLFGESPAPAPLLAPNPLAGVFIDYPRLRQIAQGLAEPADVVWRSLCLSRSGAVELTEEQTREVIQNEPLRSLKDLGRMSSGAGMEATIFERLHLIPPTPPSLIEAGIRPIRQALSDGSEREIPLPRQLHLFLRIQRVALLDKNGSADGLNAMVHYARAFRRINLDENGRFNARVDDLSSFFSSRPDLLDDARAWFSKAGEAAPKDEAALIRTLCALKAESEMQRSPEELQACWNILHQPAFFDLRPQQPTAPMDADAALALIVRLSSACLHLGLIAQDPAGAREALGESLRQSLPAIARLDRVEEASHLLLPDIAFDASLLRDLQEHARARQEPLGESLRAALRPPSNADFLGLWDSLLESQSAFPGPACEALFERAARAAQSSGPGQSLEAQMASADAAALRERRLSEPFFGAAMARRHGARAAEGLAQALRGEDPSPLEAAREMIRHAYSGREDKEPLGVFAASFLRRLWDIEPGSELLRVIRVQNANAILLTDQGRQRVSNWLAPLGEFDTAERSRISEAFRNKSVKTPLAPAPHAPALTELKAHLAERRDRPAQAPARPQDPAAP